MQDEQTRPKARGLGRARDRMPRLYRNRRPRKLDRPETGQVKVNIDGKIHLSPRWSEPSGFRPGDAVYIRREEGRIVLTKEREG